MRSQRSSRPLAPHSAFEASTGPLSTSARQVYASIDGGIQGCHVRPVTAVDGNPMSDDQLPATPSQHDTAVQRPWALEWGCTKRRRGGQVVVSQIHEKIGRGRSPSSRHLRGCKGVHSPGCVVQCVVPLATYPWRSTGELMICWVGVRRFSTVLTAAPLDSTPLRAGQSPGASRQARDGAQP